MKVKFFSLIFLFITSALYAQNVGINSTGNAPDASAGLDISFSNKGLLIPRVNLTDLTSSTSPINSPAKSLLVYNMETSTGTGFFYWDGSKWTKLFDENNHRAWLLTGNSGTTSSNFIGTTDNQPLRFKTNNTTQAFISTGGDVGIGTTNPGAKLHLFVEDNSSNSVLNLLRLEHQTTATADDGIGVGMSFYLEDADGNTSERARINAEIYDMDGWSHPRNSIDYYTEYNGTMYRIMSMVGDAYGGGALAIGDFTNPEYDLEIRKSFSDVKIAAFNDYNWDNGGAAPSLCLQKSRGSVSSPSSPEAGDILGTIEFMGGNDYNVSGTVGAEIRSIAETDWSSAHKACLIFSTYSDTERVRITGDGDVGIATTSPTERLDVNGFINSQTVNNDAVFTSLDKNTSPYRKFHLIGTYHGWDPEAVYIAGYNYYNPYHSDVNNSYAKKVFFGGNPVRMSVLLSNGYVGIGTTEPSSLLHIKGSSPFLTIGNTSETDAGIILNDDQAQTSQFAKITYGSSDNDLNFLNGSNTPRMVIKSSGKVGIGTTSPAYKLEVTGTIKISDDAGAQLILGRQDNSHEGGQMYLVGAGSYDSWTVDLYDYDFRIWSNSSNNNSVQIFNNGSGVTDLRVVEGKGISAGGWTTSSDKRLKSNIRDLPYGLNEVLKLKPVEYDKKIAKGIKNGKLEDGFTIHSIGFIAQDVYKVIPDVVYKPEDEQNDLWGIDYSKFSPVLVKAIQEQQKEIEELKRENKEMKEEIMRLKSKIEK